MNCCDFHNLPNGCRQGRDCPLWQVRAVTETCSADACDKGRTCPVRMACHLPEADCDEKDTASAIVIAVCILICIAAVAAAVFS